MLDMDVHAGEMENAKEESKDKQINAHRQTSAQLTQMVERIKELMVDDSK